MTLPIELTNTITRIRNRYPVPKSAVMPALWAVQDAEGSISPERYTDIAQLLGMTPTEVEAVATFYSMYALEPRGQHFIQVCTNVSCALRGADAIVNHLTKRIGPSGSTSADDSVTWESTVECLGGCGYAPVLQLDHHFHEHLTVESVELLLSHLEQNTKSSNALSDLFESVGPSQHANSEAAATAPARTSRKTTKKKKA